MFKIYSVVQNMYRIYMQEIKQILNYFGFSENESRVYIAIIKMGESPISQIARSAHLNRITTHHIVDRLEDRGLAVCFKKDKIKMARGLHPNALQKKLQEQVNTLDKAIPKIMAIMRDESRKKPLIRMYYGTEGFEKAAQELLERPNTTIRHIGSLSEAHKFIGVKYDLEIFIPTRKVKNIHYKTLIYKDEDKRLKYGKDDEELREVKYLPSNCNLKNNTFLIPGKTVVVTTTNELMTLVIESEDISESEIKKFDLLWSLL